MVVLDPTPFPLHINQKIHNAFTTHISQNNFTSDQPCLNISNSSHHLHKYPQVWLLL